MWKAKMKFEPICGIDECPITIKIMAMPLAISSHSNRLDCAIGSLLITIDKKQIYPVDLEDIIPKVIKQERGCYCKKNKLPKGYYLKPTT